MRVDRRVIWGAILLVVVVLLAVVGLGDSSEETSAERIQRLSYSYACPECKGQSVAESNAAVSVTIRDFIADSVNEGASDTQIRDELVRSYGPRVLLNPPSDGFSSLLWILPVVFVVAGVAGVAWFVTRDGPGPNAPRAAGSLGRRLAVVGGLAVFAVGAGYLLAQASGERGAGDSLSGSIDDSLRDKTLECEQLGFSQKTLEALQCFDVVLTEDPSNAEALTYRGWFLALAARNAEQIGEQENSVELFASAQVSLSRAIEIDPAYPDARALRGVMLSWLGEEAAACEDFTALDDLNTPAMIEGLTAATREELGCTN